MISSVQSAGRFRDLQIQGFQRLLDVKIPLRPLSVRIGANGAGKTSVLEIMALLANSARGNLSASMTDLSGLNSVLTYDRAEDLHLAISMEVSRQEPLEYSLRLKSRGVAYVIAEETLTQERKTGPPPFRPIDSHGVDIKYYEPEQKGLVRPNWEHNPLETWPHCAIVNLEIGH